jgi:hypothetical protein
MSGMQIFVKGPPPLRHAEAELTPMLDGILNALDHGRIRRGVASSLVHKLGGVLLAVAEKHTSSACITLRDFVGEVQREKAQLPDDLARDLLAGAERAQQRLGCRVA